MHPKDGDRRGQRRAVRAWTIALILLCVGTLWLEFRHIRNSLPYPRHVDENYVSGPAHRTVSTGTFHPYTFNYPSLPKYLAAAGMAVGFVRGAANRDSTDIQRLGNIGYPYYERPRAMEGARQTFVVLSVIALAATGMSAWLAFQQPATILLAPLILVTSPLFFFHSWTYLNVDIVGTCFVMLTIAACLLGAKRPSIHQSAVIPGIFAGLATGSKYTLAVVIAPVLLGIGLDLSGARRVWAWLAAIAAMTGAFLAAVPYSVIDIPGFLNGLATEAFHYASGHRGFMDDPGLPQLLYYARHFSSEFGLGAIIAVAGLWYGAVADWRRTALLVAFPAALLWLLASQRVHFPRNVLSLQPLIAMFAALGAVSLHRRAMAATGRMGWPASKTRLLRALVVFFLAVATVPPWHVIQHLRDRTDSRNLARAWIEERVTRDWTIVIPTELGFDSRGLEAEGRRVVTIDLASATDTAAVQRLVGGVPAPAIIMVPRWGADSSWAGQEVADALNDVARGWRAMETFGTNDVLINYSRSNPWGDPAFAVAVLK